MDKETWELVLLAGGISAVAIAAIALKSANANGTGNPTGNPGGSYTGTQYSTTSTPVTVTVTSTSASGSTVTTTNNNTGVAEGTTTLASGETAQQFANSLSELQAAQNALGAENVSKYGYNYNPATGQFTLG